MDCNLRMTFLLLFALIVCAEGQSRLLAQERPQPESSSARIAQAVSGSFSQRPQQPSPRGPQAEVINPSDAVALSRPSTSSPSLRNEQAAASTSTDRSPIPLKPRSTANSKDSSGATGSAQSESSAGTVLAVLVVVLLFVLGLARLFLKRSPFAIHQLPTEAIDVIGRRVVDPRNSIYVVKVGNRMILLGSSPNGLTSLSEINDPIEVATMANICAAAQQPRADAASWLRSLWPGSETVVESRSFNEQLLEQTQQSEFRRANSLATGTVGESHRAG